MPVSARMVGSIVAAPSTCQRNIIGQLSQPCTYNRSFSSTRTVAAEKKDDDADAGAAAEDGTEAEAAADGEEEIDGEVASDEVDYAALLEEKNTEIAGFKDLYQRSLAENENLRRRQVVELEKAKDFGIQKFSKDLITVADVLELAIENAPAGVTGEDGVEVDPQLKNLFDGMDGTRKMMMKVFGSNGLHASRPEGDVFDPNTMEAQFQVPDPTQEANTVAVVTRTGYILNDRVIRPATVGVVHHP